MPALDTDPEFAKTFNKMLTDINPMKRVSFASDLARDLGALIMIPTAALEQLIAKLQSEHDSTKESGIGGVIGQLFPQELVNAALASSDVTLTTLKIFLKHRAAIAQDMKEAYPERADQIPD